MKFETHLLDSEQYYIFKETAKEFSNQVRTGKHKHITLFEYQVNFEYDSIKILDKRDPYSYYKGVGSLNKNWRLFLKMFDLRNESVHGKKPITLTTKELISLCNCTLNFLDTCGLACEPKLRSDLDWKLGNIKKREAISRRLLIFLLCRLNA
jgi:hypothetical protein